MSSIFFYIFVFGRLDEMAAHSANEKAMCDNR